MRHIGALGCVLTLWSLVFVARDCGGVAVYKTARPIITTRVAPQVSSVEDDDDDFVPYSGERSSLFDWNLFKTMASKYYGNLLVSPLSLKLVLGVLYEGAQDQTAHELSTVMQLPVTRPATRDMFQAVLNSLRTTSPTYTLDIGTRLYVDNSVMTRQRYASIAKTFYEADLINTNLSYGRPVADNINAWVNNITRGSIPRMIDDERSIESSVMLILNALFFKGAWRHGFLTNNTIPNKFYLSSHEAVEVPYMHTTGRFYYSESAELNAKILRLPYEGHKYAMYLILPLNMNGLDTVITKINPLVLMRHVWLMQELPIEITLPKFKFDFTSHLEQTLRQLGIQDIFDNTATLTGIAKTRRTSRHLMVTDIVQKAGIEVNERGTTAYAASEVVIGNKVSDMTFHADRPFLFYIEDETTGTILYIGKVDNPLEMAGSTANVKPDLPTRLNAPVGPITVQQSAPSSEERFNFFNIDLLQAVNEEIEGNVIISPASAKIALMTLLEGTGGRTRQEIISTLRLPADELSIRRLVGRTIAPLKSNNGGTTMDLATRLWTSNDLRIWNNYVDILRRYYNADVHTLNFADTAASANTINDWVKQATRQNVRHLVDPSGLNPETRLFLTSALYFKGRWLNAFDKKYTEIQCFNVPNRNCQDVYMMTNTAHYRYSYVEALDADVIEIPYSDRKTSMLVLLPSNPKNDQYLQILSKDLSYIPMSVLLGNLEDTEVILSLPRFQIESKLDLRSSLTRMGIRDLFETVANLSGISSEPSLRVGNILQNAKIEVDEDGTMAAAATGISIVPLMGSTTQTFRADRPFVFAIIDLETKGTLFAGRFMQPSVTGPNSTGQ